MQVQGRHRRPSGACMDASTPHVIEVQTRRGQLPREPPHSDCRICCPRVRHCLLSADAGPCEEDPKSQSPEGHSGWYQSIPL